ncbi:hypothetical protein [Nitrosomonas mobilis]|uniref:hypothetical protein n=1 Tax=Nitrosomonas mobilis TaxID=51642 RepID=UPI001C40B5BF|nr:hypothetical protein [Nitrosomonas mobilis]
MRERVVSVDYSTVRHWTIRFLSSLENIFRRKYKRSVGRSWRLGKTHIKVKG